MARAKKVTAVDILKHARALIAKRGGWAKGFAAYDKNGNKADISDPTACSFCAYGALLKACFVLVGTEKNEDPNSSSVHHKLVNKSLRALGQGTGGTFFNFNDSAKTKRPVLAAFDKAIAKLESKTN